MESFVLALAFVVLGSGDHDPAKEANQYPYIVSIHKNTERRNYLCAGSLIALAWVLSTASCLTEQAFTIRYGDMMTKNNGTYSRILQIIHHGNSRSFPYFLASKRLNPRTNNIALALIEEVPARQVALLSGIDYTTLFGYQITFFEFGFLPVYKPRALAAVKAPSFGIARPPWIKNKGKKDASNFGGPSIPSDIKVLRTGSGIATQCAYLDDPGPNICVAKKCFDFGAADPRLSFVAPDHGAPLVYDERVVGVTSEVENQMYTPVSPYLEWILQCTEQKNPMKT